MNNADCISKSFYWQKKDWNSLETSFFSEVESI